MASAIESTNSEEKQLPNKRETVTWKRRKEYLLKNIPKALDSESEEGEFSDSSHNESNDLGSSVDCVHTCADGEDFDSEASSVPETVAFPELQPAPVHEPEDWDKELEESGCSPYDADDLYCGSFQENNLLASYSWQEDWFYNPGCHHAACIALAPPVRVTKAGQFDDADE